MSGENPLEGKASFFVGSDPSKWRTNVETYSAVRYEGVYPGVSLVYYGDQRQLEYDFRLAPGADPRAVRLSFDGARSVRVDAATGDLGVPNEMLLRILEKNTHEIPAHISYQDAALIEPLACVMRGLEESNVKMGDTVAVIGLGPIGMMFVRLAKAVYNARVIAIGRRQTQLDRAARMGADELVLNDEGADVVSPVRKLTGGRGADVVIEAVAPIVVMFA